MDRRAHYDVAKRLLDRAFKKDFQDIGRPVCKVPPGPFTPRNIFFQRVPEIGFEALFVDDSLYPAARSLDSDEHLLGPKSLDELNAKWQESPSNPSTKNSGDIGMKSFTLKLKKPGKLSCAHEPYLESDRRGGTISKISVRVYFLYNEEAKQNPAARFVKVCSATNAGNAGGNRGRKKRPRE